MRKNYIMPQTQAQTICVGQLMTGSGNTMKKNDDPLSGEPSGGIIYGN